MASKAKSTENKASTSNFQRQEWKGYVWCDLTDDMKLHFQGWLDQNEIAVDELAKDLILQGRKVSLRYDEVSGNWCCALTGTGREIGVKSGMYGLTAWRPTLDLAIALAYWKDAIFFERDWSSGILEQRSFDW